MSDRKKHTNKHKEVSDNDITQILMEEDEALNRDLDIANESIISLKKQVEEEKDRYIRLMAEYDNYKKRTIKEKQAISCDVSADVVLAVLPILDNLERSLAYENSNAESLKKGIEMVIKQSEDCFKALGIEEIEAVGKPFDPLLHNAVMHIEDENYDEQTVVDVLLKGYKMGDKVIRHSMVKVAN